MLVIAAPGQGAQTPGFLAPWLEVPAVAARAEALSAVAEMDLAFFGTQADEHTIRDTKVAQPLLVAATLLTAPELLPTGADGVDALTGHSVGEIGAAAVAGAISPEQAMTLVRERGRAMAEAAAVTPTGMTAVLGGDRDVVLAAIEAAGLTAANDNGPGQIVAAGTLEQLEAFAAAPPAGGRLRPLSVAGAFHTVHMAPAVDHVSAVASSVPGETAHRPVISNADGLVVASGADVVARIVGQIARPVRWDLCLETMVSLGITGFLELPPSGTLTGIAKRYFRTQGLDVETFALSTPDQLDDARAFCERHGASAEAVSA